jgi:hypothetical protein
MKLAKNNFSNKKYLNSWNLIIKFKKWDDYEKEELIIIDLKK